MWFSSAISKHPLQLPEARCYKNNFFENALRFFFSFYLLWRSMKRCFLFGFFWRQRILLLTVRLEPDSPRGQKTLTAHFSLNQRAEQRKVKSSRGLQTRLFQGEVGNRIKASITLQNSQSSLISARLAFKEKVCDGWSGGGLRGKCIFFSH